MGEEIGNKMKDRDLNLIEKIFIRLIAAFFIISGMNIINNSIVSTSLESIKDYSDVSFLLNISMFFLILTGIQYILKEGRLKNIDICFLGVSSMFFVETLAIKELNVYSMTIAIIFLFIIFKYIMNRFPVYVNKSNFIENKSRWFIWFIIFVAILHVGSLVVFRYFLFRTANFDFGIFAQMFQYMKTTGIPYTTCERNKLLSHFCIHFSPIFYLILPVYMIFSHPVTLIVVQLLALYS